MRAGAGLLFQDVDMCDTRLLTYACAPLSSSFCWNSKITCQRGEDRIVLPPGIVMDPWASWSRTWGRNRQGPHILEGVDVFTDFIPYMALFTHVHIC